MRSENGGNSNFRENPYAKLRKDYLRIVQGENAEPPKKSKKEVIVLPNIEDVKNVDSFIPEEETGTTVRYVDIPVETPLSNQEQLDLLDQKIKENDKQLGPCNINQFIINVSFFATTPFLINRYASSLAITNNNLLTGLIATDFLIGIGCHAINFYKNKSLIKYGNNLEKERKTLKKIIKLENKNKNKI